MKSKAVVITGAFGSLGLATALAALQQGARVAALGHGSTAPPELTAAMTTDSIAITGVDLADPLAAQKALDRAAEHLKGLDVLINAAGSFRWQTLLDGKPEGWQELFASNLLTATNASRAAIAHLRRSRAGRIVNVGAAAALQAGAGMGAYAASKAGVHRLTESLARELIHDGITVNAVLPSIIDTPANRADMPKADFSSWVSQQSLADVIFFLASEQATAITGALLPVTGRV